MSKKPNAFQQAYPELVPLIASTEAAIGELAVAAYRRLDPYAQRSRSLLDPRYSQKYCFLPVASAGTELSNGQTVQSVSLLRPRLPSSRRFVQVRLSNVASETADGREYGVASNGSCYADTPKPGLIPTNRWQQLSLYEQQLGQADLAFTSSALHEFVLKEQTAMYRGALALSSLVAEALETTYGVALNRPALKEIYDQWAAEQSVTTPGAPRE